MKAITPLDKVEKRKRTREQLSAILVLVAIIVLSNLALGLAKLSSTLPFVNSIFFFGIINLNLVLLSVLVFLIFRNLSKLFLERRRGLLGSKLKTKLVLAFISLSIIPTIVLFFISSLYINSSFDKWFSLKVGNTLQASLEITNSYYKSSQKSAQHFAEKISEALLADFSVIGPELQKDILRRLQEERERYSLDAVEIYWHPLDPRLLTIDNRLDASIFPRLPIDAVEAAFEGKTMSLIQHVGTGDVLRSIIPLYRSKRSNQVVAALTVSYHIPVSLVNKVDEISSTFEDYKKVNPLKYPIKSIYFAILVLITLLIMFVAIWIGLYLARELTVPLERLVNAVKEVGSGNLDVELVNPGNDEIATLVLAFNKMTADLKENHTRLESTNKELDEKKRYVEAVLSNISAGVCSVDRIYSITTINKSAAALLSSCMGVKESQQQAFSGKSLQEVFTGPLFELRQSIEQLVAEGGRETIFKYLNLITDEGRPLSMLVTVTPLFDSEHQYQGLVLVFDDITHLIKAQREAAWREVARRIAHEIKNPLTPIKLSAQRLQKRFAEHLNREDSEVFMECTNTIVKQVDELKEMVNEFSQFARFPTANPTPNQLNAAIAEVVGLYSQAHKNIEFSFEQDAAMPVFAFDRDQIKRVIINLFDNAIAAMKEGEKAKLMIKVMSHYRQDLGLAVVQVIDNGPGIPEGIKPLLFEPYFSTKKDGTGLGLAIAKRIVKDHDGYIKVGVPADDHAGACFTIELPIHRAAEVIDAT